jgi:hypothetical protein
MVTMVLEAERITGATVSAAGGGVDESATLYRAVQDSELADIEM